MVAVVWFVVVVMVVHGEWDALLDLLIAAVAIALLVDFLFLRARWRRVPLPERNTVRAALGGCGLMLCLAARAWLLRQGVAVFAGSVGICAFYLAVGLLHPQNSRFDFMSIFWWSIGVLGSVAAAEWWGVLGNG